MVIMFFLGDDSDDFQAVLHGPLNPHWEEFGDDGK